MILNSTYGQRKMALMTTLAGIIMILTAVHPVYGHGGKVHEGSGFTALQAVQKATELYDRLITMNKLPEDWETGLTSILVSTRTKGKQEYIVEFKKSEGDPRSVYFFFDPKGDYTGSNFTGK